MRGFSTMISLLKSLVFPSFLLFLLWFCIYIENKIFLYSYYRIYFRSVMLDFWMLEKHKYKSTKCDQFSKSFKTFQKLTALLYFWCLFYRTIALSLQSCLQHYSYVRLFCWENRIVQLACLLALKIRMLMMFWYKIIK